MRTTEEISAIVSKLLPEFPIGVVVAILEGEDVPAITEQIQSVVQQFVILYLISQGEGCLVLENGQLKIAEINDPEWKTTTYPNLIHQFKMAKSELTEG